MLGIIALVFAYHGGLLVHPEGPTDAWGPAYGIVILGTWIALAVWFLMSLTLIFKGLREIRRAAEIEEGFVPPVQRGPAGLRRDTSSSVANAKLALIVLEVIVGLVVLLAFLA